MLRFMKWFRFILGAIMYVWTVPAIILLIMLMPLLYFFEAFISWAGGGNDNILTIRQHVDRMCDIIIQKRIFK